MAISNAVDLSARARVVGIETVYKNLRDSNIAILPQRIAVIGQGSTDAVYATEKRQVTSANQAGNLFGYGSPVHLAVKQLLPVNGDGVGTIPVTVYPLTDHTSGVAATGSITPTGTVTESAQARVLVNNIRSELFVISIGDTIATLTPKIAAAINATLDMPVTAVSTATAVNLTSKWKGLSANDINVVISGGESSGVTFAITQLSGGLADPEVTSALNQIGNVWETMVLNCLSIANTDALNAYRDAGEGRWGALVRKPFVVFTGNTIADPTAATATAEARKTDRINSQLPSPGATDLPFVVAARQLARIAVVANENPPCDYGSQQAAGLVPGPDAVQWTYTDRDYAIKRGSSTVEVRDGVVTLSDVVTFYHPTGEEPPAYSYVCDIVKLQNIIFNLDIRFANKEWDGAPLIPDDQPTTNPRAKKPKMAVAEASTLADSLGLEAIISDTEYTKKGTIAQISSTNPKRLDMVFPVKVSGNTNILGVDLQFGFFFGTNQVVG
ncbi:putative tail sheath protein [Acinetobacter phage Scuro]|nr:putative tail sheath protein [Acinetobacter phage Scuro]